VAILASVCALGPLFGFLGTVDGMVEAFAAIEAAAGSGNIIQLTAAGIKVALYTTVLGLCIGIVTQLFYNLFTSKVNGMVLEVEESVTELTNTLIVVTAPQLGGNGGARIAPAGSH
jgi:biopolymer transport protein ExbB